MFLIGWDFKIANIQIREKINGELLNKKENEREWQENDNYLLKKVHMVENNIKQTMKKIDNMSADVVGINK